MDDLRAAARDAAAVWAGLYTLGIGLGVLVTSRGFDWWLAPAISTLVFAGSVEFLLVGMMASGAPLASIALTTFLVNSRHLFYGLSFPLDRVRGRVAKAYSVFALIDEAYALVVSRDPETLTGARVLWIQLGLHASWVAGSTTGALVGSTLLGHVRGLGFVLVALFVALALDAWRDRPDAVTLGLAVGSAVVAKLLTPHQMLLTAFALFTGSLAVRHRQAHRA